VGVGKAEVVGGGIVVAEVFDPHLAAGIVVRQHRRRRRGAPRTGAAAQYGSAVDAISVHGGTVPTALAGVADAAISSSRSIRSHEQAAAPGTPARRWGRPGPPSVAAKNTGVSRAARR